MDNTRIGVFRIGRKIIDVMSPEMATKIFGGMVILGAMSSILDDDIWYVAIGEMFDKLNTDNQRIELTYNFKIPEYHYNVEYGVITWKRLIFETTPEEILKVIEE